MIGLIVVAAILLAVAGTDAVIRRRKFNDRLVGRSDWKTLSYPARDVMLFHRHRVPKDARFTADLLSTIKGLDDLYGKAELNKHFRDPKTVSGYVVCKCRSPRCGPFPEYDNLILSMRELTDAHKKKETALRSSTNAASRRNALELMDRISSETQLLNDAAGMLSEEPLEINPS